MKDLTPKLKIPVAEDELSLQLGQTPMALNQGGLNMFSTSFKRGAGDNVFGADENGMWLGAADFDDAPIRMTMDGAIISRDTSNDRALYGYQSGGF